jgi:predicted DNA-binding transcriptional regulator YafY
MGENQRLVQFQWFNQQAQAGKFPNTTTLAEQFEITGKTAQRAISYFRDQLNAPLEYDSSRKGYYYEKDAFAAVPASEPTQEEMLAILVAQNILAASAQGVISQQIKSFGRKLFGKNGLFGVTEKRFRQVFSSSWNEYAPAQGPVFKRVMKGLVQNRLLTFTYTSPLDQIPKQRTIEPHHLQHYKGSWGLIAFCHLRREWRSFMLSRMRGVEVEAETFVPKPRVQWKNQMEGGFGIFQGGPLIPVRLHFNAFRAPWIREQVWHCDQEIEDLSDGSLILSFPVCEFYEVRMCILQFGGDVVVLEPEALKQEILKEAGLICGIYDIKKT